MTGGRRDTGGRARAGVAARPARLVCGGRHAVRLGVRPSRAGVRIALPVRNGRVVGSRLCWSSAVDAPPDWLAVRGRACRPTAGAD